MAKSNSDPPTRYRKGGNIEPVPPVARKYLITFRPSKMLTETVEIATGLGATVLYQSEKSFAAMVDDHQKQEIESFIFNQL